MTRNKPHLTRIFAPGIAALSGLLLIAPSASAYQSLRAHIPFAFVAGSRTLPAGEYAFEIDRNADTVVIHGPEGSPDQERTSGKWTILTALGTQAHGGSDHTDLVFDKVGTASTLSEILQPGEDGLLLFAPRGRHEHQIVHAKKS